MVKVLLDACVPQWLRHELDEFDVETARYARLDQIPDSELLDVIEVRYDVLVTLDRNLTLQQKIKGRQISVIVLRIASQSPESIATLVPALRSAISNWRAGLVQIIGP